MAQFVFRANKVTFTKFERKKFKNMRGSFSYSSTTVIRSMVMEEMIAASRAKLKTGARKSDPMPYRVHMVWDLGKTTEQWVPLSYFRHLQSAYKLVNKQRKHHIMQRQSRENLRTPTFFIEFRKTKKVRAFELTPEFSLDGKWIERTRNGLDTNISYPSCYVLMPTSLCPGKTISGTPKRHKKGCKCGGTARCKANHVAANKHVRIPLPYV